MRFGHILFLHPVLPSQPLLVPFLLPSSSPTAFIRYIFSPKNFHMCLINLTVWHPRIPGPAVLDFVNTFTHS